MRSMGATPGVMWRSDALRSTTVTRMSAKSYCMPMSSSACPPGSCSDAGRSALEADAADERVGRGLELAVLAHREAVVLDHQRQPAVGDHEPPLVHPARDLEALHQRGARD